MPGYNGSIINEGTIIAANHGLVALIGGSVSNSGYIQADLGNIVLASGSSFTMTFQANTLISFSVDDKTLDGAGVSNTGTVRANGGQILITAKTAQGVLDHVINMQGVAEAKSVAMNKGEIVLMGEGGLVKVSGKLDASGTNPAESGGTVKILGNHIALVESALIDVSGDIGGGIALIGGNAYGTGPEMNADYTYFGSDVIVNANALTNGSGGKVIVWSDLGTGFYGSISARGGVASGSGGFVETSGKEYLEAMGNVDASAPAGLPGQWLLDPRNVTITTFTSSGAFDGGTPTNTYTPTGNTARASAATINASLNAGTNVTITTGSTGTQAGTITVSTAILKSLGLTVPTLTLNAASSIFVNAPISFTSGGLAVSFISGGAITQTSPITASSLTVNSGANAITLTNASNNISGAVSLTNTGANNVAVRDSSPLVMGTTNLGSGTLALTSGGSITQTGAITRAAGAGAMTITSTVANADVLLDTQANNITGSITFGGTLGNIRDVALRNTFVTAALPTNLASLTSLRNLTLQYDNAAIAFPALTLHSGGNLSVIAGGNITQTGILNVPGTSSFSTGAHAITLTQNNVFTGAVSFNNSGANNVAITDSTPLTIGTSNVGTGTLALISGGTITQTGAITQAAGAGAVTLRSNLAASDVLLNTQANSFSGAITFGGTLGNIRDVALRNILSGAALPTNLASLTNLRNLTLQFDNAAITFPAVTLTSGGNLSVIAGGAIAQSGALTVPGTASFNAGANAITLINAANSFTGAVSLLNSGANNVSLTNNRALILAISTVGQNLIVAAVGAITQSGALTVLGTSSFSAGANAIILSNIGNLLTGAVSLSNSGANNVVLTNSTALILGASILGSGTLNLAATGTISQTGAISQAVGAGAVTISENLANADILLGSQANNFTGAISFGGTLGNIRDVTLRNINAGASLPTNLASLSSLRNLTIQFDSAGISFPALTLHSGGNLAVIAGGAITETGALTIPGISSFNAGANAITLTQNNVFTGDVFLTNSGNNNVFVTNSGTLSLGTSSVGSGTLSLTGLGVIQSGAITQAASAGAATINAGAGVINLANSGNTFTGSVSLNNSGANSVQLTNSIALVLGASNIGSGTLGLTVGGTISQTGPIVQAANAGVITYNFTAPSSDLLLASQPNSLNGATAFAGTLGNLRDVAIRNISSNISPPITDLQLLSNSRNLTLIFDNAGIIMPALTLHDGGNLILDTSGALSGGTGGSIIQVGAFTIPGTSYFNAGSHEITLTQNNSFSGAVTLINTGNNNVALTNSIGLSLAASSIGSGTLSLSGLGVSQIGAITQAVSAGGVTINGGAGVINLANTGNLFTGAVSLNNSGANDVILVNSGPLAIGTSDIGTGALSITSGGDITETGAITQAGNAGTVTLASTAPGTNIDLSTAANNLSGAMIFGGTLTNIQDFKLRNISSSAALPTNITSLSNLRNLTLQFDNSGIIFPAITLTSGGSLVAIAGGAISETGALIVPGTSSFNAASNAIILTQSNQFSGDVTLTNTGLNNVAITNAIALSLGASSVGSGTLTLTGLGVAQTGAITQAAGAGEVTIQAGAGAINLSNASNIFTSSISLNNTGVNDIQFTNILPIVLRASNVGSGALTLTSGGNISQTGPLIQEANAGITTFIFTAPSSDLLLASQPNDITGLLNIGGTLSNLRDVAFRNVGVSGAAIINLQLLTNLRNLTIILDNTPDTALPELTLHSGGSLVLDTSGALSGGTGGSISQTGVLIVPGTSSFNAGAHAITLTENNIFTGNVTLQNSGDNNVALTNSVALSLAASSLGSGSLTLTGAGVSQTGAISQAANADAVTINAGANAINLGSNNIFTGTVSLNNSGANNVVLNNVNALKLGASLLGSGTLSITTSGAITQVGAITQAASAGAVTIQANGNSIALTQPNIFTGAVSLYNSGANDVALTNDAALILGTSSVGSGLFDITASGPITQTGIITQATSAGNASFTSGANAITLTLNNLLTGAVSFNNSGANDIAFTNNAALILGASSVGSGLFDITASGPITQTGVLTVPGTSSFNVGANAITLTQSNIFTGPVSLINSGNNDVSILNSIMLTLGTSNVGSGSLNITGAGVTQTGPVTQEAGALAATINAGAGIINLSNSSNTFTGAVSLYNSGANDISLTNNAALILGASSIGSGALAITVNGTLSQAGAIIQAANAGAITLTQNASNADILLGTQANNLTGLISFSGTLGNIRDVSLRNIYTGATLPTNVGALTNLRNLTTTFDNTGMTLPTLTLTGDLTVSAGGSITQSGVLTVTGTPTFTLLTGSTLADILLASAENNFSTTPVITNNNNVRDLALRNVAINAAVPTLPTGLRNLTLMFDNTGITLPGMTLFGDLTVVVNGDILQSGALNIDTGGAVTSLTTGASNNILLTNANNRFATVAIASANNVSLTEIGDLDLGTSIISGSLTVNTSGLITQSGGLSVTGPASFAAGSTNDITLTSILNDFGTISIGSGRDVSLTDVNALDLGASVISGNLTVNTHGALTQSGALTINSAGSTATFAMDAGNILLTNVNNDFTNIAVTSSGDVSIVDNNAINLAGSTIGGDFSLTTSGAITQSGAIIINGIGKTTTLNAGSAGDITLNTVSNDFTILNIPNARTVSLQEVNDLTLGSTSSLSLAASIGGSLITTGLIQTAGGNVNLNTTEAGTITIGASGINTSTDQVSPGGSISISAANTGDLITPITVNGVLDTRGGSGGILTLGGGVQLNETPVIGFGNISLDGASHSQFFGNLTFTTAQIIAIANADLIINGPIVSTGVGSNLTFIADSTNTGFGGVRVTNTGSVNSSGFLTLQGSNLFANPGVSVELQPGSSLIAAGAISLLGNISPSNIIVSGSVEATGGNSINITPTGLGQIYLGANLTTSNGAINLNSDTQLINNVTLTTAGGLITANAISGVGQTLTFDIGSSNLTLTNANDFGTVAITSGNNIQLNDINGINLGTSTITGDLVMTADGNITNSGDVSVAGATTLTASNSGSITLDSANNNFNTVAITDAGDVILRDANAIDLGPMSITGNITVTANGAITQSGGILLINSDNKTATFAAGSANDITLNNAANDFTTIAISSANNVILQDTNALNLGNIALAGHLTITTTGDITQTGTLIQNESDNTITLAAGATHNISLANPANNIDNLEIISGNNVTLYNADAINLLASTISGNLTITAIGAISETGPLSVAGTSSFDAATNSIILTQNNQFTGPVLLTNAGNNNVAVTNNGLLIIGPTVSALGSGTLTLTGIGVTQTGAITQAANAGAVTINAGAGVINFGNVDNRFSGSVSLNNSGMNDVVLTNAIALALGASNVGTGTLSVTAGGTISETGAIIQAPNAGTVTLSVTAPSSDILLASQPNDFSGAIVYGGTLSNIRDIGRRNVNTGAGLTATNLDLLTNLRNATIILDNAGIFGPAFTLHDGGNLYVDTSGSLSGGTGGSIIQIGAVTVPGTVTLKAGAHQILATQNNTIGGDVFLTNSGDNNVAFTTIGALNIGTSSVGSGTLTLTGLGVSQSGAITQAASAGDVTINAGAGVIDLANSGNTFTGSVALNNSGSNNVSLTNSIALVMGASNVGSGTLSLTSGGTISETGPIIQAPNAGAITITLTAPSSDILFGSQPNDFNGGVFIGGTLSNVRDIARRNVNPNPGIVGTNLALLTNLRNLTIILDNASLFTGAVTLHDGGSLLVDTSGSLSGGTGGSITQLGPVTVPGTVTLNAGAHSITATQNNNITGDIFLTNSGNNNVAMTTIGTLHLGTSSVGSGTLTLTGLGVSQDGALTQEIGAGAVTINGGAGVINLANIGNIFTGAVSLNNSGANDVILVNSGPLAIGTSDIGTGALSITSGGDITETGAITQAGNAGTVTLASTAPGTNIDLSTAANNLSGTMIFGGTLTNIQDFKLRNISSSAALPTNITSLSNLRNLTLQFDNSGIIFPAITLTSGGSLVAIAGGAITQSGVLTVPGTSSFNAASNAITLTQNNLFGGDVTLANTGLNNVAITNAIALSLGASSVGSGTLTLTGLGVAQTGAITQAAGAGEVTIDAGAGAINLSNASNIFTSSISLNNTGVNDIQFTNTLPIVLRASNVGSGALTLTSGGNISQTGPLIQEANAGIMTFIFTAPSSDLLLASQPNDITGLLNIGGTLSNLRDVAFRNVGVSGAAIINLQLLTNLRNLTVILDNTPDTALPELTLHSGGNLVLDTSGALSGGTGGSISQSGVLVVPGTSSFNAGSHAITLTENNIFTGDVTLQNSGNNNVALTNSVALSLAASSVGTGSLTLTGAGISQTGVISQAGNAGVVTINAGANAINLGSMGNNFTGAVSLYNSGANNVALQNAGSLILGTSNVGTGTLSLNASGTMSQVGAITQAANAGAITLINADGGVNILFDQANDFSGLITFGGNIDLIHDVSLRNINAGAALPVNLASLSDLTNLTIVFDNAGINLPTLALHSGGSLSVDTSGALSGGTGGSIVQAGVLTIPGTASFNAGAHLITLTQSNQFTGAVSLINSGNNNVAVTNNGLLVLGASSLGVGTLSLNSLGLSQTGEVIQAADAGAVTINAGADIINLANPSNAFTGVVSLNNSGNNNVSLTNSIALALGATTIGSGTLSLTAGGTISETGAITQSANAGSVTLSVTTPLSDILLASQANDFSGAVTYGGTLSNIRDIGLRNTSAGALVPTSSLSLASNLRNLTVIFDNANVVFPTLALSGNLIATAGGTITQTGPMSGMDLTTSSVGGTTLNSANAFTSFNGTNITSGDIAFTNSAPLTITGINEAVGNIVIQNTGGISITGAMNAGGDIMLAATGTINESGSGTMTGGLLTTSSVGGTSLLNSNSVTSFNATNSSSGDIQLMNTAATLTISGITQVDSGSVLVTNTGALTTTGAINTNGGDVTLKTLSPDATARLLTIGAAGIATSGGSIDLNAANPNDQLFALVINGVLNTSPGTGGIFTINPGVYITATPIVGAGNITLNGNGLDFIGGFITVASDFVLRAPRNIILIGPVTTINGAALSLLADSDHNSVGGVLIQSAGSIDATGDLILQGSDLSTAVGATDPNAGIEIQSGAFVRSTANISLLGNIGSNANIDINGFVQVTGPGSTITITPAGTGVINLGANVLSQGGAIDFNGPVNISTAVTVDSGVGGGAVNFNNVVNGAGYVLTLQNNTAADGTVTFSGNVTLAGLTTFDQPYAIIFNGATNAFTNAITFNNTNGVTLGNGGDTFNFDAGVTNVASTTTVGGTVNSNGAPLTLGALTVAFDSVLNSTGGAISLGAINSNLAGANSLLLASGAGTTTLNGVIGGIAPLNSLTVNASAIDINTGSITANNQAYNGPVLFSTDATLTGLNIAFNNGISGGHNLSLIGLPGNDSFTLTGPLALNNIAITGSATGNNALAVNGVGFESWIITGANQGTINVPGVTGSFGFNAIQNLTGGNNGNTFTFNDGTSISGVINGGNVSSANTLNFSLYTTPIKALLANLFYSGDVLNSSGNYIAHFININNLVGSAASTLQLASNPSTLTFTSAITGFVDGLLNFNQFTSFATLNSTDPVNFIANAVYNYSTNQLTITGIPVQMSGFNPALFSGNITFINPQPVPPIPPVPVPVPTPIQLFLSSELIPRALTHQPINNMIQSNIASDLIINEVDSVTSIQNVIIPGTIINGITSELSIAQYGSHVTSELSDIPHGTQNKMLPKNNEIKFTSKLLPLSNAQTDESKGSYGKVYFDGVEALLMRDEFLRILLTILGIAIIAELMNRFEKKKL